MRFLFPTPLLQTLAFGIPLISTAVTVDCGVTLKSSAMITASLFSITFSIGSLFWANFTNWWYMFVFALPIAIYYLVYSTRTNEYILSGLFMTHQFVAPFFFTMALCAKHFYFLQQTPYNVQYFCSFGVVQICLLTCIFIFHTDPNDPTKTLVHCVAVFIYLVFNATQKIYDIRYSPTTTPYGDNSWYELTENHNNIAIVVQSAVYGVAFFIMNYVCRKNPDYAGIYRVTFMLELCALMTSL